MRGSRADPGVLGDAEGSAVTPEQPSTVSGNCRFGAQACGADGAWAACEGAVGPQARDRCDVGGDDANCDGIRNDSLALASTAMCRLRYEHRQLPAGDTDLRGADLGAV